MAATEIKKEISVEEFEEIKLQLEQTKKELAQSLEINKQYKAAYKIQGDKYDNLFRLFINNVNYIIDGDKKVDE